MSTGKLYRLSDNQLLAEVRYQVFEHPAATNWWGELVPVENISLDEGDQNFKQTGKDDDGQRKW